MARWLCYCWLTNMFTINTRIPQCLAKFVFLKEVGSVIDVMALGVVAVMD